MFTQILAASGLTVCILLGIHMALPRRWQARVEGGLRRFTQGLTQRMGAWLDDLRDWRQTRLRERAAAEEASDVIRRAREGSRQQGDPVDGEWSGNVFRPKDFEKKPDRRNLH